MENRSNSTNDSSVSGEGGSFFIEPQPWRWTLRLLFIVIFMVGSVGNLVVCTAVIRRKRMRSSNNIFTFNLALSDLMTVLVYVPTQMAAFENNHQWPFGNFVCQLVYIMIPVCLSASIATLLAITSDRYRAIAFPMKPRLSGKKVRLILVAIWTISILVALPLAFVAQEIHPAPGQVYCDEVWPDGPYSRIYWIAIFIIQYILPLGMICALAVLIALKIRKNSLDMIERTSHVVAAAVRQRLKQTSKITNMLIALVILYAICMLPQHLVYLFMIYGDLMQFKYRVYVIRLANVFPMANCALNPIAYGTLNKEFKIVFRSFFRCECNKIPSELSRVDSHFSRSRKFRLAVYKHVDNEGNSVLDYGRKWRRKSSTMSLLAGGNSRRQGNGAFRKRSGRTPTEGCLSPNGQITRKMDSNSSPKSPYNKKSSKEETVRHAEELPKHSSVEEEEKQNLITAKDDMADCSEKSYSSVSKVSEKSFNSEKSSSKSGPSSGKNYCSDAEDVPFGVYQIVESNESAEEPEECSLESITNSLEWDPMTIGSLNRVSLNNNSINGAPRKLQEPVIVMPSRGAGTALGLEVPLRILSHFYNPVENFEKYISTENNGKIWNKETHQDAVLYTYIPAKNPVLKSSSEQGKETELDHGGVLDLEKRTSNHVSKNLTCTFSPANELKSPANNCIQETEIPDIYAEPSEPVFLPEELDRTFLKFFQSVRETTV